MSAFLCMALESGIKHFMENVLMTNFTPTKTTMKRYTKRLLTISIENMVRGLMKWRYAFREQDWGKSSLALDFLGGLVGRTNFRFDYSIPRLNRGSPPLTSKRSTVRTQ